MLSFGVFLGAIISIKFLQDFPFELYVKGRDTPTRQEGIGWALQKGTELQAGTFGLALQKGTEAQAGAFGWTLQKDPGPRQAGTFGWNPQKETLPGWGWACVGILTTKGPVAKSTIIAAIAIVLKDVILFLFDIMHPFLAYGSIKGFMNHIHLLRLYAAWHTIKRILWYL